MRIKNLLIAAPWMLALTFGWLSIAFLLAQLFNDNTRIPVGFGNEINPTILLMYPVMGLVYMAFHTVICWLCFLAMEPRDALMKLIFRDVRSQ